MYLKNKIECELIFSGKAITGFNAGTSFVAKAPANFFFYDGIVTDAEVAEFHIILWSSIAYIIVIFIALCQTCYMPINLPSILERPIDARVKSE